MRIILRDIQKHYGQVRANDGIRMEISSGSVHGVLGENGAGKSTLMKILAGYVRKTGGEILLDDRAADLGGPSKATGLGVGMLYQDPLDFPPLSVLENFMVGRARGLSRKEGSYRQELKDLSDHFGFHLNPDAPVESLTVGERQQLEILRLLSLGVRVLILDEPTTGITSPQRDVLFKALKRLASEQKTTLLVSHKLEDVEAVCDRVTVLRRGKVAGEMPRPFDTRELLGWMFGAPPPPPPTCESHPGPVVLGMDRVSASGGRAGLHHCTTVLRRGEVVALAGLEGSGQGLFLRLAGGLEKPEKGRVMVTGEVMSGRDYYAFKALGVTFVPTARLEEGLVPGLTITEHFALQSVKGIQIPWDQSRKLAGERIDRFRIAGQASLPVEALSGGNQQRLLLALMPEDAVILLLEHPTRGLDVESAAWVWQLLLDYAAGGTCVVFSSAEIEEALQVANRILVFHNGVLVKDLNTCDTTLREVGQAIAGRV